MSSNSMMKQEGDVLIDIKMMLKEAEPLVTDESCIYKVPSEIRLFNNGAYSPKVVSIGPFHRGHRRLRDMERHKLIYCKAFLERTQTSLESWIQYIEEIESSFRRCYSVNLDFSRDELVKMITVDSGFIFELFFKDYYIDQSDRTLIKPWLENLIRLDLALLENQLPFFVLDRLFKLSFPSAQSDDGGNHNRPSFLDLTFGYFSYINLNFDVSNLNWRSVRICHFTDLIRTFHIGHLPRESRIPLRILRGKHYYCPSATEFSQAGVMFKVKNSNSSGLLDLSFSRGVLEIPQLLVDDKTEIVFRNMVALEVCHYPHESYITDYVLVLSCLVKTKRDADMLVRQRVLHNWLENTDSVATLFNAILKDTYRTNFNSHYISLLEDLNAFCRDPWHNLKANLRRWQGAAIIGGSISLILTLVQAVCSILQVINQ